LKGNKNLEIAISPVTREGQQFLQTISYEHNGHIRREQFLGRTESELCQNVLERRVELEKETK
jgi:hypothetical protein